LEGDHYQKEVTDKMSRRLYVSNFTESTQQGRASSLSGEMGNQSLEQESTVAAFRRNFSQFAIPFTLSAMTATFTYPIAVRIARKCGLRGFYAIHISVAPFLAWVNLVTFNASRTYMKIKEREREFQRLNEKP